MGLATQQDLEDIWRPLTSDEQTSGRFDRLLVKAEALLRQQLPNLDSRIGSADPVYGLDVVVVRQVIASIVKRYLANPSGASSHTTGPFSVSFVDRFEGKDGSAGLKGTLFVTASDLSVLKPRQSGAAIGSIRVKAGLAPVRYSNGYVSEPLEALEADSDTWPTGEQGLPVLLGPDTPE